MEALKWPIIDFFQALSTGLLVGGTYGLMCVGLGIIFGVMRVVNAGLLRYEPDGSGLVVAVRYEPGITKMPPSGERIPLVGDDVGARVLHTGRPARIDDHANTTGAEAERIPESASVRSWECPSL